MMNSAQKTRTLLHAIRFGEQNEIEEAVQQFCGKKHHWRAYFIIISAVVKLNNPNVTKLVLADDAISLDLEINDGETFLHAATRLNRIKIVRFFQEQGFDVNARSANSTTPLHLASSLPDCQIASLLLQHGADINALDINNKTPLCVAAEQGSYSMVRLLLEHNPDPSDTNVLPAVVCANFSSSEEHNEVVKILQNHGYTMTYEDIHLTCHLKSAVKSNLYQFTKWLLDNGADPKKALMCSIGSKREDMLQLLIDRGADLHYKPHLLHLASDAGWTTGCRILLHHGVDVNVKRFTSEFNCLHSVKSAGTATFLLSNGAHVNSRNREGYTPLHTVTSREIAEIFLAHGADVNLQTSCGLTPLDCHYQTPSIARLLISHQARVDTMNGRIAKRIVSKLDQVLSSGGSDIDSVVHDGLTLLHMFAKSNDLDGMKKLLALGADVNTVIQVGSKEGFTPLHLVLENCRDLNDTVWSDMLRTLCVKFDADVNIRCKTMQWSPFDHAARRLMSQDIADLFLANGVDLHSRVGHEGLTVLHPVNHLHNEEISKLLLIHGADINSMDNEGRTPLEYAKHFWYRTFGDQQGISAYIRFFEFQLIKMKTLGLYVSEGNLAMIEQDADVDCTLLEHELNCEEELEDLKRIRLTNGVCPLQILLNRYPTSIFVKAYSATKSTLNPERFPIYGDWIQGRLKLDKERYDLVQESKLLIHNVIKEDCPRISAALCRWKLFELPDELLDKIFSYLPNQHIKRFVYLPE